MIAWKRSPRMPARLSQWIAKLRAALFGWSLPHWRKLERRSRQRSFRPVLELLEARELLTATPVEPFTPALMASVSQLRDDLTTAAITVVNNEQASLAQSNASALAGEQQQWNAVLNTLSADWNNSPLQPIFSQEMAALSHTPMGQAIEQAENRFGPIFAAVEEAFDTLVDDLDKQLGIPSYAAPPPVTNEAPGSEGNPPSVAANNSSSAGGSIKAMGSTEPTVQFSSSTYYATETNGQVFITVPMALGATQTVTVKYQTVASGGTAVANKDYTPVSGTLTIPPNSPGGAFMVPLLDDGAINEPDIETIKLALSDPTNATLGNPSTAIVNIQEDSDGGLHPPPAFATGNNLCDCGCPDEPGSVVQNAPNKAAPSPATSTGNPVRYADGVVTIAQTDLHSDGFGFPWGQTRSWTNGTGYTTGSDNGNGWVDTYTPHLTQADGSTNNTLVVLANGTTAYYFDLVNGVYQSRYNDGSQLNYNSGNDTYTLIDTQGDQTVFDGFGSSRQTAQRGQFASFTDPGGQTIAVTAYTSDGHIAEMQRSATSNGNTTIESWLYSYLPAGNANAGQLSNVTERTQVNGGAWSIVQQVQYTYYDGTQQYGGNLGDLMTATVEDGSGNALSTNYYRYYTPGAANGYTHGLEYVFNAASYTRLTAVLGSNLGGLTDAQVAPYADNYFQYDSSQRVTQEVVQGGDSQTSGGLGTYKFSYTASSNTPDFNNWAMKTLVTNPDGSTDTVYTNFAAEVLLDDHYDASSGLHTIEAYRYNESGQLILDAGPSAVNGYNDSYADLLNYQNGNSPYLNNSSGLITDYDYYQTTTAGETTAGGVAGYLQDEQIQQGQQGTLIPQETWQYYAHAYNGQIIAPIASDTVYRNTDGTGAETTNYAYTWYTNSAQVQSETDSAPIVSAAENGPGTADVTTTEYDQYGNAIWVKDPDGYIQYASYDPVTGAQLTSIADVNTADTGEFSNLPAGWVTPAGGGLNLVTTDQVDALGRTIEETSPGGNITYYVYLDAQHEERIYNGWNSSTGTPTGPTEVIREDAADGYDEVFTMTAAPHLTDGAPDGTEAISGLQTLTRDYTNAAGQVIAEDAYFNLGGLAYTTGVMGTVNVNYYQTVYGYDSDGRLVRTQTPNGTIYRTVYNSLDEEMSDWVGTNDTPTSGEWSPTNNTGTANMVEVSSYQYDNGGVGDGNLTQETDYPGLGAANEVTDYWYDWRDRLVATKSGVEASENDGVNRPIIVTTYDNLDEAIETQQYDGDGVTPQVVNGVLQALNPSLLRAQEIDSYDDQGRVYQTQVYDVNPTTGAVSSSALTTEDYYDHRGDLIAESAPGGLWTKSQYDGAGRDVMDSTTDGAGGTSWAAAGSVANDTVLEQEQTIYDGDGNAIETLDSQRFHNATGTGPLGNPTSGIGARVYYAANYYDNADRLTASVDAGTNGGSAWTRPSTVPSSSATLLVTSYAYNAMGLVQDVTDPMGIDERTLYDNLGRTTETIEDYTGGTPGNDNDIATEYGYDGNNNVMYVRADEPDGNYQQTQYVYGVTTAAGDGINSNDILSAVQYPDPTTGNPSSSQQDSYLVNALGQVVQATDRNGNVHQYTYDVLGRLTADAVTTLGAGVDGSVRRIQYAYDSQGNQSLVTSYDAASGGNIVNQVQDVYNGLGQLTGEYQSHSGAVVPGTTPEVQYAYAEMAGGQNNSRLVSMTYPSGYVLNYNYNAGLDSNISRLSSISDSGGTLEAYKYLGLDTVVERDHPQNNVNQTYIAQPGQPQTGDAGDQYTGLDRFGRVVEQNWVNGTTGVSTDEFQYGYNQDGDVLYRQNVVDAVMSELYQYDNVHQLLSFARGTLNATDTGIVGTPSASQSWTPDALGNFSSVTTNGSTQTRTTNQQNEITGMSGAGTVTYDANGNLTADGNGNTYVYDGWNRLISVSNNGTTVANYSYDGLGRRITETHGTSTTDLYLSAAGQVLEERVGGVVQARNVWSPVYVNAQVLRDQSSQHNGMLDQRLYVQQDANWNVTALVDVNGNVVERYDYTPFGVQTVLNPDFSVRGSSAYAMPYGFQGMRADLVVGVQFADNRVYSPTLMRWLQSDPIGLNAGNNDYGFVENVPTDATDPSGLQARQTWAGKYYDGGWGDYFQAPLYVVSFGYFDGTSWGEEAQRGSQLDAQVAVNQAHLQNGLGAGKDITDINASGGVRNFPTATGNGTTVGQNGPAVAQTIIAMGVFVGVNLLTDLITRIGPGMVARPLASVFRKALERTCLSLEGGVLRRLTKSGSIVLTGSARANAEKMLERELGKVLLERLEGHISRAQAGKVLNRRVFPHDGIQNDTVRHLLGKNTWTEWMVVEEGAANAGTERLLKGADGQLWYSPNHYQGFIRIDDGSFKVVGSLLEH